MILVTETDVLQGAKAAPAERKDGKTVTVECRALSWAAACKVMTLSDPTEAMITAVLNGVAKDQATDEFLNALTPAALNEIGATVLQLTHGVPGLKKMQAARNLDAQPATPTSTPPPANCAGTDSAAPNVPPAVQPN